MRRRLMAILRRMLVGSQGYLARHSRVGHPPVFDTTLFPWARDVERAWPGIRAELDALLRYRDELPAIQTVSVDQRGLSDDDRWKVFGFYAFGFQARGNCRRCPHTVEALRLIPGMKTAFFSILGPRKHLKPHRGKYNGVIRYHLGLKVPDPAACRIRVDDQVCHWAEGASLIFDDTYEHEVWNDTDEDRVVLFVDVVRPLPFPASLVNWCLLQLIAFSPLGLGALMRQASWERQFELAVRDTADL
jgi:aspartyl/asparaginyl beta-hydroxylase (cupin superfamily)